MLSLLVFSIPTLVAAIHTEHYDKDNSALGVGRSSLLRSERGVQQINKTKEDFRLFFITDCTAHQKWMAFNVFNSATHAGQEGPITWVRSGCRHDQGLDDEDLVKRMYPDGNIEDVRRQEKPDVIAEKTPEKTVDFNLGFGVPVAVNALLKEDWINNQTIYGLIEADFVFMTPLRLDELESKGMPMEKDKLVKHGTALVGDMVAVAQHYQCCDNLGPPYILSGKAWREMAPIWKSLSADAKGEGWGADQVAFAKASKKAGLKFNVFDHFMVSDLKVEGEGWSIVDEAVKKNGGNVCSTKKFGLHEDAKKLPTFMHIVRPWEFTKEKEVWGFSKYQVPPGWRAPTKTDGILECGMPLFAEPPGDFLEIKEDPSHHRNAWAICTIVHSLNHMLLNYKEAKCTKGYNKAKAMKMQVPLDWTNILLEGGAEGAPEGTDKKWLEKCVTKPLC